VGVGNLRHIRNIGVCELVKLLGLFDS